MKKFKNALAILASIALLTSCGGKDEKKEEPSSSSKNEVTQEETGSKETGSSDLLDDGVLDLGMSADFPPYEYYEGDKIVGIDAEITEYIADKLGVEVKLHDMDFSTIIASIESGKLDGGASGFTVTDERKESVNFTDTYATSVQEVLVKKDSPIKTIDDLKDKKIGTQLGTTGDIYAKDDFGEDKVQSFTKYSDAVLALQNDKVDAIILDQQTAEKFKDANEDLDVLKTAYAEEEYAIAISKDNEKLLEEVNKVIAEMKENGELQKIIDKYISSK